MRPYTSRTVTTISRTVITIAAGLACLAASGIPDARADYWLEQARAPVRLRVVHAVGRDVAWVAGNDGMVMRTADGGASWDARPIAGAADVFALFGLDDQVCVVADENGDFWRTADGGLGWTHVHDAATFINGVHFFDGQNGWAVGDPVGDVFVIVESTDGGLTWAASPNAPPGPSSNGWVGSFDWASSEIGAFGTSSSSIWRTTNGGADWLAHTTSMRNVEALALNSAASGQPSRDEGLGLATGDGLLDRSTDLGATWEAIPNPQGVPFIALDIVAGTEDVWGAGWGSVYHSTNGGFDWDGFPLGDFAYDVDFADAVTGWAVDWIMQLSLGRVWKFVPSVLAADARPGPAKPGVWNHPNPFHQETVFGFEGEILGAVQVTIYDLTGRQVAALAGPASSERRMELRWDGRDSSGRQLREGVYFYRLTTPGGEASGRLVRIR